MPIEFEIIRTFNMNENMLDDENNDKMVCTEAETIHSNVKVTITDSKW